MRMALGDLTIERSGKTWTVKDSDVPAHFTNQQRAAFEKGFTARTYDEPAHKNPYRRRGMQQAWDAGYDFAKRQA